MLKAACFLVLLGLLSAPWAARAEDDWFDPAYIQADTLGFGTGFIAVPTAEVMDHNWLCGGIHRYRLKLDYGLFDILEVGFASDLDQDINFDAILENIHFQVKARLLRQDRFGLSLAVGAEALGVESLGWGTGLHVVESGFNTPGVAAVTGTDLLPSYYVVAGRSFSLPYLSGMMITAGAGSGRFGGGLFANLSKILFPGCMAEAEYDGQGTNVGVRMLLSSQIKLDLAIYHTQDVDPNLYFGRVLQRNIVFGISYTEPVQWGWF